MAKKSIIPIVALLAGGAILLASGKSSAKSTSSVPPLDSGTIPTGPQEMPPTNTGPSNQGGGSGWKVEPDDSGITADEKQAVWWALNVIGGPATDYKEQVDISQVPDPYNVKKPNQKMLDWKTNIAYWMSYASPESPYVKAGNTPAPFKIEKGKPNKETADHWASIWLKLREYIKTIN